MFSGRSVGGHDYKCYLSVKENLFLFLEKKSECVDGGVFIYSIWTLAVYSNQYDSKIIDSPKVYLRNKSNHLRVNKPFVGEREGKRK